MAYGNGLSSSYEEISLAYRVEVYACGKSLEAITACILADFDKKKQDEFQKIIVGNESKKIHQLVKGTSLEVGQKLRFFFYRNKLLFLENVNKNLGEIDAEKFTLDHKKYFKLLLTLNIDFTDFLFGIIELNSPASVQQIDLAEPADAELSFLGKQYKLVECLHTILLHEFAPLNERSAIDFENFVITDLDFTARLAANSDWQYLINELKSLGFRVDVERQVNQQIENLAGNQDFIPAMPGDSSLRLTAKSILDDDPVYQHYKEEFKTIKDSINKLSKGYDKIKFGDGLSGNGIKAYFKGRLPRHHNRPDNFDEEDFNNEIDSKTTIADIKTYLSDNFNNEFKSNTSVWEFEGDDSLKTFKEAVFNKWKEINERHQLNEFFTNQRKEQLKNNQNWFKKLYGEGESFSVVGQEVYEGATKAFGANLGSATAMYFFSDKKDTGNVITFIFKDSFSSKEKAWKSIANIVSVGVLPFLKAVPYFSGLVPILGGFLSGFISADTQDSEEIKLLHSIDGKLDKLILKVSGLADDVLSKIKAENARQNFKAIVKEINNKGGQFVDIKSFFVEIEKGRATRHQIDTVKEQLNLYRSTIDSLMSSTFGEQWKMKEVMSFNVTTYASSNTTDVFSTDGYVGAVLDHFYTQQEKSDAKFEDLKNDLSGLFNLLNGCLECFYSNMEDFRTAVATYALKTSKKEERKDSKNIIALSIRLQGAVLDEPEQKEITALAKFSEETKTTIDKMNTMKSFILADFIADYKGIFNDGKMFVIAKDKSIMDAKKDESILLYANNDNKLLSKPVSALKIGTNFNEYRFKAVETGGGVFKIQSGQYDKNAKNLYLKTDEKEGVVMICDSAKATSFSIGMDRLRRLYLCLAGDTQKVLTNELKIGDSKNVLPLYISVFENRAIVPEKTSKKFLGLNLQTTIQPGNYLEKHIRYFSPSGNYYYSVEAGELKVMKFVDGDNDHLEYVCKNVNLKSDNTGVENQEKTDAKKREVFFNNSGSIEYLETKIKENDDTEKKPKYEFETKTVDTFKYGVENSELSLNDTGNLLLKDRAGDVIWDSQNKYAFFEDASEFVFFTRCAFRKSTYYHWKAMDGHPAKNVYTDRDVDRIFQLGRSANSKSAELVLSVENTALVSFKKQKGNYGLLQGRFKDGSLLYLTSNKGSLSWEKEKSLHEGQRFGLGRKYNDQQQPLYYAWLISDQEGDISKRKLGYPTYTNIGKARHSELEEACTHNAITPGGEEPLYFRPVESAGFFDTPELSHLSAACYNADVVGYPKDGRYFFFKGAFYWERMRGGAIVGPYHISSFDPNLPEDVDAVCYNSSRKSYLFFKDGICYQKTGKGNLKEAKGLKWPAPEVMKSIKAACYNGSNYYLFSGGQSYLAYPYSESSPTHKTVADDWGGHTPDHPDAVLYAAHVNSGKGGYYFFKDDQYQSRSVGKKTDAGKKKITSF